jgi:hypothetical protein
MCRELHVIANSPFLGDFSLPVLGGGSMGTVGVNIGCITRSNVDGDRESWRQFNIG